MMKNEEKKEEEEAESESPKATFVIKPETQTGDNWRI